MPDGQLLEFDRVTKRFGDATAVSEFSGRVEPGLVTGFLGPNGAGKTTTLLMLLGQIRPTSGSATIGGAQYSDLKHPARVIGAMYENPGFRPRRTVERHLAVAAKTNGIAASRVAEVISFVGLEGEADSRIGALSLGMRQRLSAATALLGDPGALVLDEPANGLDPEGIRWMRMLIRGLADEGRTVLVSSHVLSEVEQIADEILVIAHGQRKFAGSLASLADPTSGPVVVDAVDRAGLTTALAAAGYDVEVLRSGLTVRGSDASTIGAVAAKAGIALTTLQQRGPTLEDVFLDLVNDRPVQLRAPEAAPAALAPAVAETAVEETAAEAPAEPADDASDTAVAEVPDAAPIDSSDGTAADDAHGDDSPVDGADAFDGSADADTEATDTEASADADATDAEATADTSPEAFPARAGSSPDGDEDDVSADEIETADAFTPVSLAADRPLPGSDGLAAAAAGVTSPDAANSPDVSNVWAALIAGNPKEADRDEPQHTAEHSETSLISDVPLSTNTAQMFLSALAQDADDDNDDDVTAGEIPADEIPADDESTGTDEDSDRQN